MSPDSTATLRPNYDVLAIRQDFPILAREVFGKPLVYLDTGASAQIRRRTNAKSSRTTGWSSFTVVSANETRHQFQCALIDEEGGRPLFVVDESAGHLRGI